jgi:GAF domain-containing protein
MARRSRKSSKRAKSRRRRGAETVKRRVAPTLRRRRSPALGRDSELARLRRERDEALERETATSEVLRIISSSSTDLQSALGAIAESAARLLDVAGAEISRVEGDDLRLMAKHGAFLQRPIGSIRPINRKWVTGRAVVDRTTVQVLDLLAAEGEFPEGAASARQYGHRTTLATPLLREGKPIGAILIRRMEVRPFTDKQIALLQNFAAQAVIAIENARLFEAEQQRTRELAASLEQQTATSEVLRVISSSAGQLEPIFHAMLENATRICEANFGNLWLREGDAFRTVFMHGATAEYTEARQRAPLVRPSAGTGLARVLQTKQAIQIADIQEVPGYVANSVQAPIVRLAGARTMLSVPMLKEEDLLGVIEIYRTKVHPFTDKQIELVQNFAAQAVIAIENARLLNELRESLQQQTATADVLKVISRSTFDLQSVLNTLTESATRLCEADKGAIMQREGDVLRIASNYGFSREAVQYALEHPLRPDRGSATGRAAVEGKPIHIPDVLADQDYQAIGYFQAFGYRTILAVPLLREGTTIGTFTLTCDEVSPFTEKQIELVTTFADQAVIAIENARLLNELRQRTGDLTESLQQQTATSEILDVISGSPTDSQPAFDAIVRSGLKLFPGAAVMIALPDGDIVRSAAVADADPAGAEALRARTPLPLSREFITSATILDRREIDLPDVREAPPELAVGARNFLASGYRAITAIPMMRGESAIGALDLLRREPGPLSDKQRELLRTFANQAVIAIENTRLFNELRQRTTELGRSVSELQALGEVSQAVNSTLDLETVLSTIVAKAAQLSGTEAGAIYGYDEQAREFRLRATYGMDQELIDALTQRHINLDDPNVAEVFAQREPVQVADLRQEAASELNEIALRAGYRARMVAPLLRGEDIVGMLAVRRRTPGEFAKNTVDIIKAFAAQSALAILNARLFHEIEDKSRQLEVASQHKSQFLANMSHELRTPLNAILGYTELMADGAYGEPSEKMLGILKRLEANGRHLLGLINDVLDLSKIEAGQLELELSDYSVQDITQTVRSTLEPLAADKKLVFKVEMAPKLPPGRGDGRRLTQVLINLVGNAIKFTDAGEVAIMAEENNGSFHVAVRDTGPGISAVDQAKLFQEFQQADNTITRKKGGTGLGLAISKRIIEMHGGKIWIESRPGHGSKFTFTLPVIVDRQVEVAA